MVGIAPPPALAQDAGKQVGPPRELYRQTVDKAIQFLRTSQAEDGSYSAHAGPAVTAIAAAALLKQGLSPDDPLIARSLEYLRGFAHPDGGIYKEGSNHQNYETCLAIMAFTEANRDGKYDELIAGAEKFIRDLQWDDGEGHDASSTSYGGAGYGSHKRPDLSNTQFFLDALKATGATEEDPAVQKALAFVSRCQNLETEHNTTEFAAKNPDGGFYYTIAAGGSSQAGETPEGGLRSYGSMTYAGLKSMIFAGVGPDDPRVKAAYDWVKRHYTLAENPGMGGAGLYYYYHTFAKALDAIGEATLTDSDGKEHDWRAELAKKLAEEQNENGSWTNETTRWLEGDPNLVTSYALLALSYCQPQPANP
jgi:squalene-hopene/tetraprenyl-beta-curcumene cyclase